MMNTSDLKYNYVIFNNCYNSKKIFDPDEFNAMCFDDIRNNPNIQIVDFGLDYTDYYLRQLCYFHMSKRKLPFKSMWYPFLFKSEFNDDKPICFVSCTNDIPIGFYYYLKKKYKNAKFVKIHRDLLKVTYLNRSFSEENMRKVFDLRMTYDYKEAQDNSFEHFDAIYSKHNIDLVPSKTSDIVFIGKIKDRLDIILNIARKLNKHGLKCCFILVEVPEEKRQPIEGVKYIDKLMSYKQVLEYTVNSKCILDINQKGGSGLTYRIVEAIVYDKKVITDNPYVTNTRYFNNNYMKIIDNIDDIDADFIKNNIEVTYNYNGEFSPVKLIEQIESLI